jgi:hypothetical protein
MKAFINSQSLKTTKSCFILTFGCLLANFAVAQSTNNSIKVYKAQVPNTTDLSTVNNKSQVSEATAYYDGLGREMQSVARQQSPAGNDVVIYTTYDRYGKKSVTNLPYVSAETNGNLKSNAETNQTSFYQGLFGPTDGAAARSVTVFERSELGRVREQGAPGAAWQIGTGNTIKKDYVMNVAEEVLMFNYNVSTGEVSVTPGMASYFPANMLFCNKVTDEQQNDIQEFVDKEGRTVCKKVKAAAGVYASTYYIYDPSGNLAVVIPPEGVKSITDLLNQQ